MTCALLKFELSVRVVLGTVFLLLFVVVVALQIVR